MRSSIAIALATTALLGTGCGSGDDDSITGSWKGELTEKTNGTATGETFAISLDIESLEASADPAATVSYPNLGSDTGCSGEWKYERQNDSEFFFKETITQGRNKSCFGSGAVKLVRQNPNRLYYEWKSGNNSSTGFLARSD